MVRKESDTVATDSRVKEALALLSKQLGITTGDVIALALRYFARALGRTADRLSNVASDGLALDDQARAHLHEILSLLEQVRQKDPGFIKAREAYIRAEACLNAADDPCEGSLLPKGDGDPEPEHSGGTSNGTLDKSQSPDRPLQRLARLLNS